MAISESELSFIEMIFRPVVDMHVDQYKAEGHTLVTAWAEFLKAKPEGTSGETHDIMWNMFSASWDEEK